MEVEFVMGLISLPGPLDSTQLILVFWRAKGVPKKLQLGVIHLAVFVMQRLRSVLAVEFVLGVFAGHKYSKRRNKGMQG